MATSDTQQTDSKDNGFVDRRTELEKLNWALLAHNKAATVLSRAENKSSLLSGVCRSVVSQTPYELAWVGIAEQDDAKTVRVVASEGTAREYTTGLQVSWSAESPYGLGPAGTCIRTGVPSLFKDCATDTGFAPWRQRALEFGLKSVVACPFFDGTQKAIGAMLVYASEPNAFGEMELRLFESLAKEIGAGLRSLEKQARLDEEIQHREEAQQRLADALRATIEAVSKTMERRDPYTAGHQRRVALISAEIAKKLSWPQEKIEGLYLAAMVHDIGKVAVPSDILTKPTRLTHLEMQLVQEHVETGYQILKDIPFPWPIAEMVHQHHERLDGSGYPRQLTADEILPEAKILAVADVIEAMAMHRPYRPALGLDKALSELKAESGVQLDSAIVDAACALNDESDVLMKIISS